MRKIIGGNFPLSYDPDQTGVVSRTDALSTATYSVGGVDFPVTYDGDFNFTGEGKANLLTFLSVMADIIDLNIIPIFVSATILDSNPDRITIVFSKEVRITSLAGFSVMIGATQALFSSVSGSESTTLTIDISYPQVNAGDVVTLEYNSAIGNLRSLSDDMLPSIGLKTVTNSLSRPVLLSAEIHSDARSSVLLTFDRTVYINSVFGSTINKNGVPQTLFSFSGGGTKIVTLSLGSPAAAGDVFLYSYSSSSGSIKGENDVVLASISGFSITNEITGIAPVLNNLAITSYTSSSIVLTRPTLATTGSPAPTMYAYLGYDGTITNVGAVVSGYIFGPFDVSAAGYSFSGLNAGTAYKIIVVAQNATGYSVKTTTQTTTATTAPTLNALAITSYTASSVTLTKPTLSVAGSPTPTVLAYIGLASTIAISGTTVTGKLQGPIDVSSAAYTFPSLTANTSYKIIVVAQNTAGYSVQTTTQSTASETAGAPVMNQIALSLCTNSSLALSKPTFSVAGSPAPSVEAYLGIYGTISVTDDVVSDYDEGPIDVSSMGCTFTGLDAGVRYVIIVVASNVNGYSVKQLNQMTYDADWYDEFLFGVWLQDPNASYGGSNITALYKAIGVNTFVGLWEFPGSIVDLQMAALLSNDMKVYAGQSSASIAWIEAHPAYDGIFMGYGYDDEADMKRWNSSTYYPQNWYDEGMAFLALDGTRKMYTNWGKGFAKNIVYSSAPGYTGSAISDFRLYMGPIDICSVDLYGMTDPWEAPANHGIWVYGWAVKNTLLNSRLDGKIRPVMGFVETSAPWKQTTGNWISQHMQTQWLKPICWNIILSGGDGIIWFCHDFSSGGHGSLGMFYEPGMMAEAGIVTAYIQSFASVLRTGTDVTSSVSIASSGNVNIIYLARSYEGSIYIFAQGNGNSSYVNGQTVTGTITVTGQTGTKTVTVVDESRVVTMTSGVLTDVFTPYQLHIYQFSA